MVKLHDERLLPIELQYVTTACHFGPDGYSDPLSVHAIYYYPALMVPMGVTAYHFHDLEESARLEALLWLGRPQLVKDMCMLCRSMAYGPSFPRWNIYRGQNQKPVPPCQWWDVWMGDPPWPGST
jgi:hypothetical protein